jgi:hypothetical protein
MTYSIDAAVPIAPYPCLNAGRRALMRSKLPTRIGEARRLYGAEIHRAYIRALTGSNGVGKDIRQRHAASHPAQRSFQLVNLVDAAGSSCTKSGGDAPPVPSLGFIATATNSLQEGSTT